MIGGRVQMKGVGGGRKASTIQPDERSRQERRSRDIQKQFNLPSQPRRSLAEKVFKMKLALPLHSQLAKHFGANAELAQSVLWFSSIVLGAIACKIVYDLTKVVSPRMFQSYQGLTREKQMEWDNRGFSTAHAIFCTVAAGYLLYGSDVFSESAPYGPVPFRSSIFSYFTIGFSTGYFVADLAMILWTYPSLGGPEYVVHHLLSIVSLVLADYIAHAHFYVLMTLFSEVSTPFINFRWYLLTSGMKNSKAFIYNGLMLVVVWLFARIILFIYFFYHLCTHYDTVSQLYRPGFYFMFVSPPTLAIMNVFWFYKILAGAFRVLFKRRD
ncbi:hypothetical protein R1flu_003876 [Riccia fluitans]|uniref:TLC domain-containing protein n=1 Tax=Riccia fluitans TaxID=41844 RepID=A0ABD1YAJ9_9MARC